MLKTEIDLVARYSETDQMGVVHHRNYAVYLEEARVHWLECIGMSYVEMERNGIVLPVSKLEISYKIPIRFGDRLRVTCELRNEPGVRLIFDYNLFHENGALAATGTTVLVFVGGPDLKPTRPDKTFLEKYAQAVAASSSKNEIG